MNTPNKQTNETQNNDKFKWNFGKPHSYKNTSSSESGKNIQNCEKNATKANNKNVSSECFFL